MILKYYPVCECGYIFKQYKCIENKEELEGNHSDIIINSKPFFIPSKCPKCGESIDGLEITYPRK